MNLMKFLEPTRKPKVIYTDNSLEFGKSCEELSWNHCTSTKNGIAERAIRRVKEGTSAVVLQSGLVRMVDASELHAKRLDAKEVLTLQRSGNFIFPVADGTVKIFGRGQRLRTTILIRDRPERGEEQILQGNLDEWHTPSHLQEDSNRDDAEAKHDFRFFTGEFILSPSRGTQSQKVHAERRIISYSAEVHRRYQNDIYTHHWMFNWRENEDYWNVDG